MRVVFLGCLRCGRCHCNCLPERDFEASHWSRWNLLLQLRLDTYPQHCVLERPDLRVSFWYNIRTFAHVMCMYVLTLCEFEGEYWHSPIPPLAWLKRCPFYDLPFCRLEDTVNARNDPQGQCYDTRETHDVPQPGHYLQKPWGHKVVTRTVLCISCQQSELQIPRGHRQAYSTGEQLGDALIEIHVGIPGDGKIVPVDTWARRSRMILDPDPSTLANTWPSHFAHALAVVDAADELAQLEDTSNKQQTALTEKGDNGRSPSSSSFRLLIQRMQESPHEHQQTLLLSRIITNIEKLNEAVMMMNKSLQVRQSYCVTMVIG